MMKHQLWAGLLFPLLFAGTVLADTVFLTNGDEVSGTVVEDTSSTVLIRLVSGALRSIRRTEVDTVVYERKQPAAAPLDETINKPSSTLPTGALNPAAPPPVRPVAPQTEPVPPSAAKKEAAAASSSPEAKAKEEKPGDNAADAAEAKKEAPAEEKRDPLKLAGFPELAKRMSAAKEKTFLEALDHLASDQEDVRAQAKAEIAAMGTEVIPYLVAGIQHSSVYARTACMQLIGDLNGRNAVKAVIEVFNAAMPAEGQAATYQVPFIDAIKTTLPRLTGESFITVAARESLVQDGLKKYIAWYNENYDRLPIQAGEPELDPTDPEYMKKLKELRELKLVKRDWPRPPLPADLTAGVNKNGPSKPLYPPALPTGNGAPGMRQADAQYRDSIPTVDRSTYLQRPQDKK